MLDSMLKRKEYSNTGKYVFPGIAYDCSLNWYRRFLKSAGNGRVHKKRVSYLYRTATTTYPCLIPHLGESVGAGRIRLTRDKIKQIRYICRWSNKRERYGEAETDGQIEGAGANPVQATIQQESIHLFGLLIRAT